MNGFMNEFKSLEKLCNELYGDISGVTHYINDMDETPSYIARRIPGWSNDLANLKKVRHIRNQISHNPDYSDDDYEQEDIEFIRQFHQRILDRTDPLALRRQLLEARAKVQTKVKTPGVPVNAVSSTSKFEPYYPDTGYNVQRPANVVNNGLKGKRNKRENLVLERIATAAVILAIIAVLILIMQMS